MSNQQYVDEALFIDEDRFIKLMKWARISAKTPEENVFLLEQLNKQLVEMISKLFDAGLETKLSNVSATIHGLNLNSLGAPMREDIVEDWPDKESWLQSTRIDPEGFFVAPANE